MQKTREYRGWIAFHKNPRQFGIYLPDLGKTWHFDFTRDAPNEVARLRGHFCGLVDETACTVNVALGQKWELAGVKFDVLDWPDECEVSTVISFVHGKTAGFAKRDACSCDLYWNAADVITLGHLEIGTQFRHKVRVSPRTQKIRASEIEIYQP